MCTLVASLKGFTDRQTNETNFIPSTADTGGNNVLPRIGKSFIKTQQVQDF